MKNLKFKNIKAICAACAILIAMSACTSAPSNQTSSSAETSAADSSQSVSAENSASEASSNYNAPGELPIVKESVTIKICTPQNPSVQEYETNKYTKYIEDSTNIKLEFELLPSKEADAKQKFDIMVASGGELPDVIMGLGQTDAAIYKYGTNGIFLPLTQYYENSAYWITNRQDEIANKDFLRFITSPDKNIYYVPHYNENLGNEFHNRGYINEQWLKDLGLSAPTTTDELYDVLVAFRDGDPNKNGIKDEIPLVGASGWGQQTKDFLMNSFIYDDSTDRWLNDDGKLSVAFNTDAWKDGLAYQNKLYEAGLIFPASFTQDEDQFKTLVSGEVNVVGMGTSPMNFPNTTEDRYREYVPQMPVKGPDGVQFAIFAPSMPSSYWFITKDCSDPETAFRLADFMWNPDASMLTRFGEKGVDWLDVSDDPSAVSAYAAMGYKALYHTILEWGPIQNSHWQDRAPAFRSYISGAGKTSADVGNNSLSIYRMEQEKLQSKQHVAKIVYTPEETAQISDIKLTINTYVDESMVRFITGDLSVEKDWDKYISELNKMGLEEYISVSQTAFTRTMS